MRLKPRYSLLTLLVLTALVAGGVKLWYGPHRAVVSDPPTAEEEALLMNIEEYDFWPITYEYEYINEWNTRKYLHVKAFATGNRLIPVLYYQNREYGELYLRSHAYQPELLEFEASLAKAEHVVCWHYDLRRRDDESWSNDSKGRREKNLLRKDIYFLTSRKQILECYQFADQSQYFKRVKLSDIVDPEFRSRVAEDLVKIPADKNPE